MWLAVKSTTTPEIPAKALTSVMPTSPTVRDVIDRSSLEVGEDQREDVGHGDGIAGPERGVRADQHRAVSGIVGQSAVGSAHEMPVQRDHVHHVPEAQHLLSEAPGDAELA